MIEILRAGILMAKSLEQQYFEQATSWDDNRISMSEKSERRAWIVALFALSLALILGIALIVLVPLKSVDSFLIRVDNNTGAVDFISKLTNNQGLIDIDDQKALDKHWLSQYIRAREGYQWETRQFDRDTVGVMSDIDTQQKYDAFTDPKKNPQAPVSVYNNTARVFTKIKSTSFIKDTDIDNESFKTALVRYTKTIQKRGERDLVSHWAATVTFKYVASAVKIDERLQNPLGFQVTQFKIDQESHLGADL